jgi:hypothetical protein
MGVNIMDEVSSWTKESLQVPKIIKTGKESTLRGISAGILVQDRVKTSAWPSLAD